MSRGNFCQGNPEPYGGKLDATSLGEASGLCMSSNGTHFYVINDSPGDQALIFVFEKNTLKRSIIEVTGVKQTGFNPQNGAGYGDWEAVAVGVMPDNPDQPCIIIGDIGHNKVRNMGGTLRTDAQQTRLIYVEEPTEDELSNSSRMEKPGTEYPIQYGNNLKFDAEAMTVVGDSVYIITKNVREGDKKSYVYACPHASLRKGRNTTLECKGEMTIPYSEVTDASVTTNLLALRTYQGVNFYDLSDLRRGSDATLLGYQKLDDIARYGAQEAMTYDPQTQCFFFLGEGSRKVNCLKFDPLPKWAEEPLVKLPNVAAWRESDSTGSVRTREELSPQRIELGGRDTLAMKGQRDTTMTTATTMATLPSKSKHDRGSPRDTRTQSKSKYEHGSPRDTAHARQTGVTNANARQTGVSNVTAKPNRYTEAVRRITEAELARKQKS